MEIHGNSVRLGRSESMFDSCAHLVEILLIFNQDVLDPTGDAPL